MLEAPTQTALEARQSDPDAEAPDPARRRRPAVTPRRPPRAAPCAGDAAILRDATKNPEALAPAGFADELVAAVTVDDGPDGPIPTFPGDDASPTAADLDEFRRWRDGHDVDPDREPAGLDLGGWIDEQAAYYRGLDLDAGDLVARAAGRPGRHGPARPGPHAGPGGRPDRHLERDHLRGE